MEFQGKPGLVPGVDVVSIASRDENERHASASRQSQVSGPRIAVIPVYSRRVDNLTIHWRRGERDDARRAYVYHGYYILRRVNHNFQIPILTTKTAKWVN